MKRNLSILKVLVFTSLNQAQADFDPTSGAFHYKVSIPAIGRPLREALALRYSSRSLAISNLGSGWCAPWTTRLESLPPNRLRLRDCGQDLLFTLKPTPLGDRHRFTSSRGDTLDGLSEQRRLRMTDGSMLTFDGFGRLLNRARPESTQESFHYDSLGRLRQWRTGAKVVEFNYFGANLETSSLVLPSGQTVGFRYNQRRLIQVETPGLRVHLTYDDFDNLTVVRESTGRIIQIDYQDQEDRVEKILDGTDCVRRFHYSRNFTVAVNERRRGCGGEPGRTAELTYDADGLLRASRTRVDLDQSPRNLSFLEILKPQTKETYDPPPSSN